VATQETVDERYRCPGWWPWQWFRTCVRRVTRWCYDFAWVYETRYGFVARVKACENGILYEWWAFAIGFGSSQGAGRACYRSARRQTGRCAS